MKKNRSRNPTPLHRAKRRSPTEPDFEEQTWDDQFAFIADFTSGGAAFGITWDEYYRSHRSSLGMAHIRSHSNLFVPAIDSSVHCELAKALAQPDRPASRALKPICAICRTKAKLISTRCCGALICDDLAEYSPYSPVLDTCSWSHEHYTICGFHSYQGHAGPWTECEICRSSFEPELYDFYSRNYFNTGTVPGTVQTGHTVCNRCQTRVELLTQQFMVILSAIVCLTCAELEEDTKSKSLAFESEEELELVEEPEREDWSNQ